MYRDMAEGIIPGRLIGGLYPCLSVKTVSGNSLKLLPETEGKKVRNLSYKFLYSSQ
jgi:hypothetical protein